MITYLTDVEGRWDKLASFASGNPCLALEGEALRLADDVTFVFGGDAIDRGPHGRRIIRTLLAARRAYGDRVVLLAGNRDINKMRLWRELDGAPPDNIPEPLRDASRGEILRWIFSNTMGARDAANHRATELAAEGRAHSDNDVAESYLEDLAKGGPLREYLLCCQLGYRAGNTLFLHGGATEENLCRVPGIVERSRGIDEWISGLNDFYAREVKLFDSGMPPAALIAYQMPLKGTRLNQGSVIYSRPTDELGNPVLPSARTLDELRESGVHRLIVGHTPSGDCPAILRDGDFEMVLADNSYGRLERGSQVSFTDRRLTVAALTELDGGERERVHFTSELDDRESPVGHRDRDSGYLIKGKLERGDYLLFRGLPGYKYEQIAATPDDVARRTLIAPR